MSVVLSPGVVATRAEAARCSPAPLVVLEEVATVLDAAGHRGGPVTATPIAAGNSNLTFVVERDGRRWVLRRPPRPPYPPSTHDVLREHAILDACGGTSVRAPRTVGATGDPTLIGAPFYLMDHIDGIVITSELPLALEAAPAACRTVGDELVFALAEIHGLDWRATPLRELYRGDDYAERQLRRFSGLWQRYRDRPVRAIDEAERRLRAHTPPPGAPTLVHGDYRLGNTMFALVPHPRLLAVLDWEMSAIGDPLADLGYLVATWAEPGDADGTLIGLGAVTARPGFPNRAGLRDRYAERTGRDMTWLPWYEALANWKSAVLLEGSYQRWRRGEADDPFFAGLATGVPELAARSLAALDRVT